MAEKKIIGHTALGTPMYMPDPLTEHQKWEENAAMHDIVYEISGKEYFLDDEDKAYLYVCPSDEEGCCDLTYRYKVDKKTMKIVSKDLYWPEPKEG